MNVGPHQPDAGCVRCVWEGAGCQPCQDGAPPMVACRGCSRFTRGPVDGRCRDCRRGWVSCPEHGRLEHAGSDHHRVTVAEVLAAMPLAEGAR